MSSHPDADAFVRAFLRRPQDETARLVFADWLEDTGEAHNAAWAGYIRAKASAARHEFGSPEWRRSDDEAAGFAADVRANLTLPVGFFLNYPASLLRLLPGPNITVLLADATIPNAVIEVVPESISRESHALPLVSQGTALVFAMYDPRDRLAVRRLGWMLNKDIIAVRAGAADLRGAVDRAYGMIEFVDSAVWVADPPPAPPLIGLEGDRDSWQIGQLFAESFRREAAGIELELGLADCRVYYLPRRSRVPDDEVPATVFGRLLDHLRSLPPGDRSVVGRRVGVRVGLPALGHRWLPVVFETRLGEEPPRWLRLAFPWM
jgi:uncharacterized protein (TIGR02996 family)